MYVGNGLIHQFLMFKNSDSIIICMKIGQIQRHNGHYSNATFW